eukprot:jgi/Botrbrau1/21419/Bobra.0216s0034.2
MMHVVNRDGPDPLFAQIAGAAKRVAVLGIKPEDKADQPAFFVAESLHSSGVDVIPVPVYYPDVTHILGKPVLRKLTDIQGKVDILDVFRRPQDIPAHVPDILELRPEVVWLQSGITHPEVEEQLAREGIKVVSNRCLKVDRQLGKL